MSGNHRTLAAASDAVYECGRWRIDVRRREVRADGVAVPLGLRAFQILHLLVRSAGLVVSKDAIMEGVWQGTIIEENTLQVHITAIRRALGSDRAMLRTASGQGYRLIGEWVIVPAADPALSFETVTKALSNRPLAGNLPVAVSQLVGRDQAVEAVRDLLTRHRTVTLAGAGGIGKTELALEVARTVAADFQGNVGIVELASLSDPGLVASVVAFALGLEFGSREISPEAFADAIGSRRLLLLLDSCEHLVRAAARLADIVVERCPNASILATSREILRINGEQIYHVPSLTIPGEDDTQLDSVLGHSAVQLLVARMRAATSGFVPRDTDREAISTICRQLDGIPLAIEFAASRAAALGLSQVAARLSDRFGLLTGGRRTALSRHQTLRAVLDWSYELLNETERRLLRHLAIFAGGFTPETAAALMTKPAVSRGSGRATHPVSSLAEEMAGLVAKSLVTADRLRGEGRWRLLDTTRSYALGKLAECGEFEAAARRHAEVFRDLSAVSSDERQLHPSTDATWQDQELDNVRSALDWAFSPTGDQAVGIVLTAAYVPVWLRLSLVFECRERVERALQHVEPDSSLSARLIMQLHFALGVSLCLTTPGHVDRAVGLDSALRIAERASDIDLQMRAVLGIWISHFTGGDYRGAEPAARKFCQLAAQKGDQADILIGDRIMGNTLHYQGHQAQARRHLEHMLQHYVAPADKRHTTWFAFDQRVLAHAVLARVLWMQGNLEDARRHSQAALRDGRIKGNELSLCYSLAEAAGPIAIMTGDFTAAAQAVTELIAVATQHDFNFLRGIGRCLEAKLLIRRGELAEGILQLQAALDGHRLADYLSFHVDLAEALAGIGHVGEGLRTVQEALVRSERDEVRWCIAEALRVKGELFLLETDRKSIAAGEGCLLGALQVAQRQGALFWELRAAMSLARLRVSQHRPLDARELLRDVHDRFDPRCETSDLRAARAMLQAV